MMFPISMAPRPHSSISEGFLHSIFSGLRRILGGWNPLLRMNEAWMDECAARLQPLVDQYKKPRQHQTFAIEKIPRFDSNNPIMSLGQKKISFKKDIKFVFLKSKRIKVTIRMCILHRDFYNNFSSKTETSRLIQSYTKIELYKYIYYLQL